MRYKAGSGFARECRTNVTGSASTVIGGTNDILMPLNTGPSQRAKATAGITGASKALIDGGTLRLAGATTAEAPSTANRLSILLPNATTVRPMMRLC